MKPSTLFLRPNATTGKIFRNETVKDLVHRHLSDPNHVITDEEIRNARITSIVEETAENLPINEEADANTALNTGKI